MLSMMPINTCKSNSVTTKVTPYISGTTTMMKLVKPYITAILPPAPNKFMVSHLKRIVLVTIVPLVASPMKDLFILNLEYSKISIICQLEQLGPHQFQLQLLLRLSGIKRNQFKLVPKVLRRLNDWHFANLIHNNLASKIVFFVYGNPLFDQLFYNKYFLMGKKKIQSDRINIDLDNNSEEDSSSSSSASEILQNLNDDREAKQLQPEIKTGREGLFKKQKSRPIAKVMTKAEKSISKRVYLQPRQNDSYESSSQEQQNQRPKKSKQKSKPEERLSESEELSDQQMINQAEEEEDVSSNSSQSEAEDQSQNTSQISSQQTPISDQRKGKVKREDQQEVFLVEQTQTMDKNNDSSNKLGALDILANQVGIIRQILQRMESSFNLRNNSVTPVISTNAPALVRPQSSEDINPLGRDMNQGLIKMEGFHFKQEPNQQGRSMVSEQEENRQSDLKQKEKKKKKKAARPFDDRIKIE